MPGWSLEIDPTSEDAANTALNINDGTNYRAMAPLGLDPPGRDATWTSSADTEGQILAAHRESNREISVPLRVYGSSAANLAANLTALEKKVDKLNREGGALKITSPSTAVRIADIVGASAPQGFDNSYAANNRCEVPLIFEARPYLRGAETSGTDKAETTLPAAIQIDTGPGGEVPALGRLRIDEDDADNQAWVIWGLESRYFDETDPSTKKLFYQAEDLRATGGSAAAAGPSGASGSASNKVVTSGALISYYTQILSMKASNVAGDADGAGSYPAHVGTYRVFARVQVPTANTGEVSLRLEWGDGDFLGFTENDAYTFDADSALEGNWVLLDLGLASPTKAISGTQQWDARIAASSTDSGDTVHVDYLMLVPTEYSGQAFAVQRAQSSSVGATARDSFDTHTLSTALSGKTPPVAPSGNWSGAGDADDFTISLEDVVLSLNQVAYRTAASDSATTNGRFARCGTGAATNVIASAKVQTGTLPTTTTGERWVGLIARYTDTSNWLFGGIKVAKDGTGRYWQVQIIKRVAGTLAPVAQTAKRYTSASQLYSTLTLSVNTAGQMVLTTEASWTALAGGVALGTVTLSAQHADLATGGTLATGGYGIYDVNTTSSTPDRRIDDFVVQATSSASDAALYASQSLEIRHDRVVREDSAGALWQPPSRYEGDYLRVPAAGNESRSYRWIVKASRGRPGIEPDSAIDDISAQMHRTPRYLGIGD